MSDGQGRVVSGVSAGAIFSSYQKVRVESVCERLGLTPLCFLWEREQEGSPSPSPFPLSPHLLLTSGVLMPGLMREMIAEGVEAILIKTAALGLDPDRHLGLFFIQSHYIGSHCRVSAATWGRIVGEPV